MFEKSASARHKNEISVTITLASEAPFDAAVFIKNDERLIDLLNDDRLFIPVKRGDGATLILSKSSIVSIVEGLEIKPGSENAGKNANASGGKKSFDPFKTLRVSRDATHSEIRNAYKIRLKAIHPDTMAGLDLDEDLTRAAHQATQKVNRAYQKIIRDREAEAAKGGACANSQGNAR